MSTFLHTASWSENERNGEKDRVKIGHKIYGPLNSVHKFLNSLNVSEIERTDCYRKSASKLDIELSRHLLLRLNERNHYYCCRKLIIIIITIYYYTHWIDLRAQNAGFSRVIEGLWKLGETPVSDLCVCLHAFYARFGYILNTSVKHYYKWFSASNAIHNSY